MMVVSAMLLLEMERVGRGRNTDGTRTNMDGMDEMDAGRVRPGMDGHTDAGRVRPGHGRRWVQRDTDAGRGVEMAVRAAAEQATGRRQRRSG